MKLSLAVAAVLAACVHAGRPKVSISLTDGNFADLDGLNPSLAWEGSSSSGDLDISYGLQADVRPTTDVASLPRSMWGKVSTNANGWGLSARADVDAQNMRNADVEVDADNEEADLSLRIVASAGANSAVHRVEATKGMDLGGDARLTINPRYNMDTEEADVIVGYSNDATNVQLTASADNQEVQVNHKISDATSLRLTASADNQEVEINHQMDNTGVRLTASADNQEVEINHQMDRTGVTLVASADNQRVTVSQRVTDVDTVSPTLDSNGDMSVTWSRDLGDDNSLVATLKPNDSLDLEWVDNGWTANINMPVDGANVKGANVSIKRDIEF